MLRNLIKAIGVALLLAQAANPALADNWPVRPIKLVVPYAPGGSTDVTARVIAENLRLTREIQRLAVKLRQAETIIDIQKKLSEILGIPLPPSDYNGSEP